MALFFWWTTARLLDEPVELAFGAEDPAFVHSLGALLGAPLEPGNEVTLLSNGVEIFPAMLEAIRSARSTITLESYIWSSGEISDQFIEALSERARNGVKTHVIVDGIGRIKLSEEDQDRMIAAGIEFLVYGREHWYEIKANINHRTHRKILVVDGRIGFTGGMCIDDAWMGDASSPQEWREIQLRIEGPAVSQMQSIFATNWLQTTSRVLVGPDYFPAPEPAGRVLAHTYKSGPNEDPENARISYLMAIASARESIRIAHAYFVPDDLAIEMLLDARQRGVRVQVLVPALSDSRFGRAASRSRWGKLLAAGVEFHLYQPAMFHAKMMIVDDAFLTLGSVNFDNRSFGINDEINVNIINRPAVAAGLALFEEDLAQSVALTLAEFENRPWWVKRIDWFCGLFRSQL